MFHPIEKITTKIKKLRDFSNVMILLNKGFFPLPTDGEVPLPQERFFVLNRFVGGDLADRGTLESTHVMQEGKSIASVVYDLDLYCRGNFWITSPSVGETIYYKELCQKIFILCKLPVGKRLDNWANRTFYSDKSMGLYCVEDPLRDKVVNTKLKEEFDQARRVFDKLCSPSRVKKVVEEDIRDVTFRTLPSGKWYRVTHKNAL